MKKYILLSILSLCLIFSYGCEKKTEVPTDTGNKTQNQEVKDDKQEDKKTEEKELKKEDEKPKTSTKTISALFFKDNTVFVFDKAVTADQAMAFLSENDKIDKTNNTLVNLSEEDGKIKNAEKTESIKVLAKYIGLSDATSAQFSYNSKSFTLNITNEQMEKLDNVQDDQLLELEISNPEKENENFVLKSFEIK